VFTARWGAAFGNQDERSTSFDRTKFEMRTGCQWRASIEYQESESNRIRELDLVHTDEHGVHALTKSGAKTASANIRLLIELGKPYQ
jgi:hypothetical protein